MLVENLGFVFWCRFSSSNLFLNLAFIALFPLRWLLLFFWFFLLDLRWGLCYFQWGNWGGFDLFLWLFDQFCLVYWLCYLDCRYCCSLGLCFRKLLGGSSLVLLLGFLFQFRISFLLQRFDLLLLLGLRTLSFWSLLWNCVVSLLPFDSLLIFKFRICLSSLLSFFLSSLLYQFCILECLWFIHNAWDEFIRVLQELFVLQPHSNIDIEF